MSSSIVVVAQKVLPLYPGTVPDELKCNKTETENVGPDKVLTVINIINPTITVYLPEKTKSTGTAVLICPGGGYSFVSAGHEGSEIALAFNRIGVAAFVLRYRLPDDACMVNKQEVPLMDAQQAIYLIRKNAGQWNIDTARIGVIGFSAGGHVASTLGTHFDRPVRRELAGMDLRPDFMMLIYPVISFRPGVAHMGSRDNLLGPDPADSVIHYYSNEEQITPQTPPTFLAQASDDDVVSPQNSILFYEALLKNHVPAELHLYEHGGHGFGLHNPTTTDHWFTRCEHWMKANKWL